VVILFGAGRGSQSTGGDTPRKRANGGRLSKRALRSSLVSGSSGEKITSFGKIGRPRRTNVAE